MTRSFKTGSGLENSSVFFSSGDASGNSSLKFDFYAKVGVKYLKSDRKLFRKIVPEVPFKKLRKAKRCGGGTLLLRQGIRTRS